MGSIKIHSQQASETLSTFKSTTTVLRLTPLPSSSYSSAQTAAHLSTGMLNLTGRSSLSEARWKDSDHRIEDAVKGTLSSRKHLIVGFQPTRLSFSFSVPTFFASHFHTYLYLNAAQGCAGRMLRFLQRQHLESSSLWITPTPGYSYVLNLFGFCHKPCSSLDKDTVNQ